MLPHARPKGAIRLVAAVAAVASATSAIAQVAIQQVDVNAIRGQQGVPQRVTTEADYILGSQAGSLLLSPAAPTPQIPGISQARTLQIGNGNVSNIDTTGLANIAIQSVIGNQNSVSQQQNGNRNQSTVNVLGSGNSVGTQQQDVSGASATITIRGDNNSVSAEQVRNATPVSITQVGNGGNVAVTVSRK